MIKPPSLRCCREQTCHRGYTSTRYWDGRTYWAFHRAGPGGTTDYTETFSSYLKRATGF